MSSVVPLATERPLRYNSAPLAESDPSPGRPTLSGRRGGKVVAWDNPSLSVRARCSIRKVPSSLLEEALCTSIAPSLSYSWSSTDSASPQKAATSRAFVDRSGRAAVASEVVVQQAGSGGGFAELLDASRSRGTVVRDTHRGEVSAGGSERGFKCPCSSSSSSEASRSYSMLCLGCHCCNTTTIARCWKVSVCGVSFFFCSLFLEVF